MWTNRNIPSLLMGIQTSIVLWKTVWQYFYEAKHNFTIRSSICTFRYRHTLLSCTIFCYTSPIMLLSFFFFFNKLKVFKKIEGNPTLSKSISKLHLLTSHLGVTFCEFLQYLNFFHYYYILYLLWWSVISDLWCYYYSCFELPQTVFI